MRAFAISVLLAATSTDRAFADEPSKPATNDVTLDLTAAQRRDDLIFLRDTWKPQDKSFNQAQTQQFNQLIADTLAHVDKLDAVSFWMAASRAVALSGNGHTNIDADVPPLSTLPVAFWWFRDGLYIIAASPKHADLLGARIEAIGNGSADAALAAVAPYISGNADRVRRISPAYLGAPALLHRVGLTKSDTETRLTVRLSNGKTTKVSLTAEIPSPKWRDSPEYWEALIPAAAGGAARWLHVLDAVKSHPDIYQPRTNLTYHWVGDGHQVFYLRSNEIYGTDANPMSLQMDLLKMMDAEFKASRPHAVIIDLRLNSGGNFLNTILFAQALPAVIAPGGKIMVLMSASTFSAAIVTAAMIRENAGSSVIFLGTNMGDNDEFYAEGGRVSLPNSKLGVRQSSGLHDWTNGCRDLDRCFWATAIWGPRAKISLHPDFVIDPTYAEYAAGRDPVMEKALALAAL
jgi:hypothetical protein